MDWWEDNYEGAASKDPQGPETGTGRVVRGGGWGTLPQHCRVARRSGHEPGIRSIILGFRLAVPFS